MVMTHMKFLDSPVMVILKAMVFSSWWLESQRVIHVMC